MICFLSALHLLLLSAAAQQFAILQPPATPTTIEVQHGPPPAPANATQAQLPQPPTPALGTRTFEIGDGPADGYFQSIPVSSDMLGISIELSIADDFFGSKIGEPAYQFLNYLTTISAHSGQGPVLRIGGNTQDTAIFDPQFLGVISKTGGGSSNGVPLTPSVQYGPLIFNLIAQVADILQAKVVWGVNMVNNTAPFTVPMATEIKRILGDKLIFYLVGNEPDRYNQTGKREDNYDINQYMDEWKGLTDRIISADYQSHPKRFAAPSVCCIWTTQQVLDAGFKDRFSDRIAAISAIKYPQSRCQQTPLFYASGYLWHPNTVGFAQFDADAIATAVANNIPYYLVETNTASCIGIDSVSETYTSAIWAVDAGMQLAFRNHTGVFLHSGGQSTLYNLFTPPAFNSSNRVVSAKAWRTGPVIYSMLVVGEALRPTQPDRKVTVTDQAIDTGNAAAYNIYEDNVVSKRLFINMVNDPNGTGNDLKVSFAQPPGNPIGVPYKLLTAPSLLERDNITWAGQTFGYYSEGILKGQERILRAPCTEGKCTLSVPPASIALIFVSTPSSPPGEPQYPSVTSSAYHPVGTNNPQIVLQSNGDRGRRPGATSRKSALSASAPRPSSSRAALEAVCAAILIIVLTC